ncbi:MAG: hypothetical protein IPP69_12170 [Flavobacteriales bacterium]|nr:hypothetical protein [Flavobacteriales bacterium]
MKILTHIIFFALLHQQQLFAQDCDCLSNLNWVIETFQSNDAGYQMSIIEKGKDFDQRITETSRQKAAHVSTKKNVRRSCLNGCIHFVRNTWVFN